MPSGFQPLYMILGMLLPLAGLTCLTVALLGDELFHIEVVLNRALVYTLLTLLIVAVYALVVGYLSLLFQSQGSVLFSLLATGLVAVLFQPLRQRELQFVRIETSQLHEDVAHGDVEPRGTQRFGFGEDVVGGGCFHVHSCC